MRRLAATLFAPVLFAAALPAAPAAAQQPLVDTIRFGVEGDRTRIVIESDRPLAPPLVFTLAEEGARVVVDLEQVEFDLGGRDWVDVDQGVVAGYHYADYSPTVSRVVLNLAEPAEVRTTFQLNPLAGTSRYRLVVDLYPTNAASFAAEAGYPQGATGPASAGAPGPRDDAAPSPQTRVVVVDAGHGGHDVGAIGADGTYEKTVSLALAREVRDRLEAIGYEVVMTRDDDSYVKPLDRVVHARDVAADLMVSIHADADPESSATHGASVYTLLETVEYRSAEILAVDPQILDVDLSHRSDDVKGILVDLIQSDTQTQSSRLAELLLPHLDEAGPLVGNSHRRGNLMVLLAPDVPSVLVEAGFMTNSRDEARLTSRTDRAVLADAIVAGIEDYFEQRERLYAAR